MPFFFRNEDLNEESIIVERLTLMLLYFCFNPNKISGFFLFCFALFELLFSNHHTAYLNA